jgi:hypothetical protein
MTWQPISESELWDKIIQAEWRITQEQTRLWELLKILPTKWRQHQYGDTGVGFWVVGLIGNRVVWYNDIEDGFNVSQFRKYGEIVEYRCNQDELEETIQSLSDAIRDGYGLIACSPPQAGEYTP